MLAWLKCWLDWALGRPKASLCDKLGHTWGDIRHEGCSPIEAVQYCIRCPARRRMTEAEEREYYNNRMNWH